MLIKKLGPSILAGLMLLEMNNSAFIPRKKFPEDLSTNIFLQQDLQNNIKNPRIIMSGLEIHYFTDKNKNGIYEIPEETMYAYRLREKEHYIPDILPDNGAIACFTIADKYPEGIRIVFKDVSNEGDETIISRIKSISAGDREYPGKPMGILDFKVSDYKKEVLQKNFLVKFPLTRRYRLECYSVEEHKERLEEWCCFYVSYTAPQIPLLEEKLGGNDLKPAK